MAAPIYAPGIAQSTVKGTVGTSNFALVWHWRFGTNTGPWIQSDAQLLADNIGSKLQSRFQAKFNSIVRVGEVDVVDLTDNTPATATGVTAAWVGTNANNALDLSTCYLINFRIAARYRGGHPRTYLPGVIITETTSNQNIISSAQTSWQTAFQNFINDLVALPFTSGGPALQHCAVRYTYQYLDDSIHHKYLKVRNGYVGSYPIVGYVVHPVIASQRRRLNT